MPLPPRRRPRPARAMLGAHARRAHARRRREDGTLSRPLHSFRAFLRPCQCAWAPAARSHLVRDHRHGRPADVPRADAHDVHLGGLRGRRHHHHHAPAPPLGALRPASSQPPLSAGLPLPPAPRVRAVWWRRGGDPPQLPHPARARASIAPCAAVSAPARERARTRAIGRAATRGRVLCIRIRNIPRGDGAPRNSRRVLRPATTQHPLLGGAGVKKEGIDRRKGACHQQPTDRGVECT